MTDLGNPYQALGKETVHTSNEQSHKETCLKFSPTAWGMKPHIRGFCSPRRGGFLAYIFVFVFWGNSFNPNRKQVSLPKVISFIASMTIALLLTKNNYPATAE